MAFGRHLGLSKSSLVLIAVLLSLGQFGMYALIVVHIRLLLLTVCLLLDQIKPIGQLVPVN